MISLPSSYLAPILIAALVAALLFHLSRMLGRQRWVHAAYAAAAVGLIYLLGAGAFGWAFDAQDALFWLYAALFVVTGAIAARRRATLGAIGLPWLSALIQLGVVAYMFAPEPFRKPPVTAALFLYFLFEAVVWLRGREEEPATTPGDGDDRKRPPLFPPPRRRGVAEASLAVAAISIAYLLFVGPRAANVGPNSATAQQQDPLIEEAAATAETPASEERRPRRPPLRIRQRVREAQRASRRKRRRRSQPASRRRLQPPPWRKIPAFIRPGRGTRSSPSPGAFTGRRTNGACSPTPIPT